MENIGDPRLIADLIPEGEEASFQIATYLLDRSKIKTMDNLLDVVEWLLGEINLEVGMAEDLFLQAPIAKYFIKVVRNETEESESQSKP